MGGRGGGGVFWGIFGGVVRKFNNVTKIFLFLWKKIFGTNFIGNAHPTTLFLGKTSDSFIIYIYLLSNGQISQNEAKSVLKYVMSSIFKLMFGISTFYLRRGWSGGHSHDRGPNFIDF